MALVRVPPFAPWRRIDLHGLRRLAPGLAVLAVAAAGFTQMATATAAAAAGTAVSITNQQMEGSLSLSPGDWVDGGYQFSGGTTGVSITFDNAEVTLPVACSQGGSAVGTVTVPLATGPYTAGANGGQDVPWASENPTGSPVTSTPDTSGTDPFQGAVQAPDLCSGGAMYNPAGGQGASFSADVLASAATTAITIQFHYRVPAAKGGAASTNCANASDPDVNPWNASVCGASVSATTSVTPLVTPPTTTTTTPPATTPTTTPTTPSTTPPTTPTVTITKANNAAGTGYGTSETAAEGISNVPYQVVVINPNAQAGTITALTDTASGSVLSICPNLIGKLLQPFGQAGDSAICDFTGPVPTAPSTDTASTTLSVNGVLATAVATSTVYPPVLPSSLAQSPPAATPTAVPAPASVGAAQLAITGAPVGNLLTWSLALLFGGAALLGGLFVTDPRRRVALPAAGGPRDDGPAGPPPAERRPTAPTGPSPFPRYPAVPGTMAGQAAGWPTPMSRAAVPPAAASLPGAGPGARSGAGPAHGPPKDRPASGVRLRTHGRARLDTGWMVPGALSSG